MNNKSKSKKVADQDDDDWKCKMCGCPAKHTPLKRTGRDGKKVIYNKYIDYNLMKYFSRY
jgi:hypothetical protein